MLEITAHLPQKYAVLRTIDFGGSFFKRDSNALENSVLFRAQPQDFGETDRAKIIFS
jgi:hypothetical protein